MGDFLNSLISWVSGVLKSLWADFVNFFNDLWIGIADTVLQSIASTVSSIPTPDFLDRYSLGTIISLLPSDVLYFVSLLGLTEAFYILGLGVSFRMVRKVVTLFQW